jgi:hypothetical protein
MPKYDAGQYGKRNFFTTRQQGMLLGEDELHVFYGTLTNLRWTEAHKVFCMLNFSTLA